MAIYSGSSFGTIKGKLGDAVARKNKGQNVVQSYQPTVSNPKTAGQVTQRGRLGEATKMAYRMASFLLAFYRPTISTLTARNQWVSNLLKNTAAGNITPTIAATTQIPYTRGTLTDNGMTIGSATHATTTLTVPLTFTASPLLGTDAATDTVSYMILNQTTGAVVQANTATARSAGTGSLTITGVNATDVYTLVVFFRNVAGTANSTSVNRLRLVAGVVTVMNGSSTGPWG